MRFVLAIVTCVGVFLLPWWATAGLLLLGFVLYPKYLEGCVVALIFDMTYGGTLVGGFSGVATVLAVIAFSIRAVLSTRLRSNVFLS